MTAYFDMGQANALLKELWQPTVDRFVEEERELAERMKVIGPLPPWWRPFARREWREHAAHVHRGWAYWCICRASAAGR